MEGAHHAALPRLGLRLRHLPMFKGTKTVGFANGIDGGIRSVNYRANRAANIPAS